jgi:hypothetical protein
MTNEQGREKSGQGGRRTLIQAGRKDRGDRKSSRRRRLRSCHRQHRRGFGRHRQNGGHRTAQGRNLATARARGRAKLLRGLPGGIFLLPAAALGFVPAARHAGTAGRGCQKRHSIRNRNPESEQERRNRAHQSPPVSPSSEHVSSVYALIRSKTTREYLFCCWSIQQQTFAISSYRGNLTPLG